MFNTKEFEVAISHHAKDAATIGFLGQTCQGRPLLIEPAGHFGGVTRTIPKVQVATSEHPVIALRRCIQSKLGLVEVESLMPIPGSWSSSKGKTVYFTGLVGESKLAPDASVVQQVHPLERKEAIAAVGASPNAQSRVRDIEVLHAASQVEVVPHRVVMKALGCLHERGFQRLRAYYWSNGLSTRLNWVPTMKEGSMSRTLLMRELEQAKVDVHLQSHSLSNGQRYFAIPASVFDTPDQLAQRWLEHAPVLGWPGFGQDGSYAKWYREALDATDAEEVFHVDPEDTRPPRTGAGTVLAPPPPSSAE
jgi:hypothetical protein